MCINKALVICLLFALTLSDKLHPLHNDVLEIISAQPTKNQFKLWHYVFQRPYDINSEEGLRKYKTFKKNLEYIKRENAKNKGYTLGLGPFTDLSFEEFSKVYLTLKSDSPPEERPQRKLDWFDDMVDAEEKKLNDNDDEDDDNSEDPSMTVSKDWAVVYKDVKNQNPCGSCWAFGTVGAIEGFTYQMGLDMTFSEQQLVDCSVLNSGCNGGTANSAFKYIREFGIMSDSDYKYEGRDADCRFDAKKVKLTMSFRYCSRDGWYCDDKKLMKFLKDGPYASSILAGEAMQHYRSGEISPEFCDQPNHAVVVVQLDLNLRRIKIRNSWGAWWGTGGYGFINIDEHSGMRGCGLLEYAFQPQNIKVVNQ